MNKLIGKSRSFLAIIEKIRIVSLSDVGVQILSGETGTGKELCARAIHYLGPRAGKPIIRLKGVSLMGVTLPNDWLGGMKNIDLVQEFSAEQGFWRAFADGVASIDVADGTINIVMKE